MSDKNTKRGNEKKKQLSLVLSILPILILVSLLCYNMFYHDGEWLGGYSNHYILLLTAFLALTIGLINKVSINNIFKEVLTNLKSVVLPIVILLLVGVISSTWLISGVVPAMIYYGLQVLNPTIFLTATVLICSVISLATGSSWTTSATVGVALIGIASQMGIHPGMAAGAIISGAYFGDKISPLSDTTNLAPAMAGTDIFTHIKYMLITTVPSILITLLIFTIIGLTSNNTEMNSNYNIINDLLLHKFTLSPMLFLVPLTVVVLILLKVRSLVALSAGAIIGAIVAVLYQPDIIKELAGISESGALGTLDYLKAILNAMFFEVELALPDYVQQNVDINVDTKANIQKLFRGKGIAGMLWTIYLIISAMVFGGIMDGIGALSRITASLLSATESIIGLFISTVLSCLALNLTAADHYLAIVITGKMFKKAYHDKGLAPENLSRVLEDSGTVTSALIPWNTCGAYQSGVLGVSVEEYIFYAFFNILSPIFTLIFAALNIKIKYLKTE